MNIKKGKHPSVTYDGSRSVRNDVCNFTVKNLNHRLSGVDPSVVEERDRSSVFQNCLGGTQGPVASRRVFWGTWCVRARLNVSLTVY